ncbi:MAG: lipid-A-disaccharide synthase [Gammaproteobacteria bacterium]
MVALELLGHPEDDCDASELSVMGLFEVLGHLPRLAAIKRAIQRRLLADPPAALLGIDAPDFNLRVEKAARRAGIPTVHYVCPSVWAWRESRVRTIRRACDRVLCLLPFEADFLARHGIDGHFVGHPLADEIEEADRESARRRLGLGEGPVVAILPGSRYGEVTRIGPDFARTAARLATVKPGLVFSVAAATPQLRDLATRQFAAFAPGCEVGIVGGRAHEVLAACDAALLASGTVTLEAMLLGRPMVVAYRLAPLTYRVARLLKLVKADYISLPNLLADQPLVAEYVQGGASPAILADAVLTLLDDRDECSRLVKSFRTLHDRIRRSAADRSAAAVLEVAGLTPG